jgi:DNA-binding transcriptional MerR regulator
MAREKADDRGGEGTGPDVPRKLYSVGEVVKQSGISRQVLHNYTVLGLLTVAERTPTNRRYYDEAVFRRIKLIRKMLDSGYTLQSLREIFPWEE